MIKEEAQAMGEIFKQRRKEMNLSLKEIENATSIRSSYLQSIEEGELKKLISPIYAQGFVTQYAAFLGLDGEQIIKSYPEIFKRVGVQEFSYGIGTLEVRSNPSAGIKGLPNALWIGLFLVILLGTWFLARSFDLI